jgi:ferredoxin
MTMTTNVILLLLHIMLTLVHSFHSVKFLTKNRHDCHYRFHPSSGHGSIQLSAGSPSESLLTVTLEKPLGLLLEEIQEGSPQGVKIQDILESGSAYASEYKDQLVGRKVVNIMGTDVSLSTFDMVMDIMMEAPSMVTLELESIGMSTESSSSNNLPEGTPVTLQVVSPEAKSDSVTNIQAKVGDNLRSVLLDQGVDLYRGFSKKLGNCGGGGQCTFCAVLLTPTTNDDNTTSSSWTERSEWETQKIGKRLGPSARLACLTLIEGPAIIKTL